MQSLLVFLAIATLSVLASSRSALRLGRFLPVAQLAASGLTFLLLGAVLGPRGLAVFGRGELEALSPLLALGLGFAGLIIGLNLDPALLRRIPGRVYLASITHGLVAFLLVAGPLGALLHFVLGLPALAAMSAAVLLGAAGSVSSGHFAILWYRSGRMDRIMGLAVSLLSMLDDVVALLMLALALALGAAATAGSGAVLVLLAALVGVLSGVLLAYLLRGSDDENERVTILLGGAALVAGAAAYLRISPLLAGLTCGAALAFVGGQHVERGYQAVARAERPVYLLLVFLVGAHVDLGDVIAWGLMAAFVALRFLGKMLGGWLAAKAAAGALPLPRGLGYALMAQGGLSLCLVIEYRTLLPGAASQLLLDAIALATVVNEIMAANLFSYAVRAGAVPVRSGAR